MQQLTGENSAEQRSNLIFSTDLLENNLPQQAIMVEQLECLASEPVLERFEAWKVVRNEDFDTLASQEKYTFRSRKSAEGVGFRTFSREFITHLGLDESLDALVAEFYIENKGSGVTYRKKADRKYLTKVLGRPATDEEVAKYGIRKALELSLLTTVNSCAKGPEEVKKRLEVIMEQDTRYKMRVLKYKNPDVFPEDIVTLSWGIPYDLNQKVLALLV